MILEHLDPGRIQTQEWFMLELRSERTSEETIRRIGKELKTIFQGDAAQVFIPVIERDHIKFVLSTECYLFVRADDPVKVSKLRRVTGVQGILSTDESVRCAKFLKVPHEYVLGLINQCQALYRQRGSAIKVGCWVRIVDGQMRDFCGHVTALGGDRAMVRVAVKTKLILVETRRHNLLSLNHLPPSQRVFYYSEAVKHFLSEGGPEAEQVIAGDCDYNAAGVQAFVAASMPLETSRPQTNLHARTVTYFVRSLVHAGEPNAGVILTKVAEGIRRGNLQGVKTALTLWHIMRNTIRNTLYPTNPPSYTELVAAHGDSWLLSPQAVKKAMPELQPEYTRSYIRGVPKVQPPTVSGIVRKALHAGHPLHSTLLEIRDNLSSNALKRPRHMQSLARAIRTTIAEYAKEHPGYIPPKVTTEEITKTLGGAWTSK